MPEADVENGHTNNGVGLSKSIPIKQTKSGSWFIAKGKIRKTLEKEKDEMRAKMETCESLEENDHIFKHCNELFLSIMDPDNFNPDLECITTVDRKKVCSHLMGENKFSLLHIAILLENTRYLEEFLHKFGSDLNTGQLSGKHCISAMHIAAQGNYAEGIDLLLKYKANIDLPDSRGQTPLHHATNRKSTEATTKLIKKGAALNTMFKPNLTTLALVLSNTPSAKKAIIERLDRSITLDCESLEDKLSFNFELTQWKMSTGDGDQPLSVHDYDLVHVFAKEENMSKGKQNSDLIKHPLVQKMLEDAWTKNMRYSYYFIFIFKFICMALITGYVLNGRKPFWLLVCSLVAATLDLLRNLIALVSFLRGPTTTRWYKTLLFYYLTNFQVYCHWTRLLGSFLFIFSDNEVLLEMCSPMIFLAGWFDIVLMFGETRVFGLYMDMFYCVLMNFFKILGAFGMILVGFASCFWLYFHQQTSFSMVHLAITKVIVMFIGEIDYGDLIEDYLKQTQELTAGNGTAFMFSPSEKDVPQWYLIFPLTSICIFVIAVPIVLQGLLIGIVVQDIAEIRDTAVALQLKRNANHLEYVVNSIDSSYLFLNTVLEFLGCSKLSYKFNNFILQAQMDDIVRVEYSLENNKNNSRHEYLHIVYEIANGNASNAYKV